MQRIFRKIYFCLLYLKSILFLSKASPRPLLQPGRFFVALSALPTLNEVLPAAEAASFRTFEIVLYIIKTASFID